MSDFISRKTGHWVHEKDAYFALNVELGYWNTGKVESLFILSKDITEIITNAGIYFLRGKVGL